jgi:polyferredoxin
MKRIKTILKSSKIERTDNFSIQPYRKLVQFGFLAVTIWIGVEFALFVQQLERGFIPGVTRPPGVEAFLPISALISLKYWFLTGVINKVHPAALVLLIIAVATGLLLKKGFCSWVCPVGLLSEYLTRIHRLLFRKIRFLPRWIDYPLRSLKYILLFFFLWSVFIMMEKTQLEKFIYSPYNKVADIKMLKFFTEMSAVTFWSLLVLVLLSIVIPFFWCRFLCPYGAMLGGLSWLSVFKVHRNDQNCIDCEMCTMSCPANISVHTSSTVLSDECHACLQCVDTCPVKNTLHLSFAARTGKMPRLVYALIIVLLFVLGTSAARFSGYWHNDLSAEEYIHHIRHLEAQPRTGS